MRSAQINKWKWKSSHAPETQSKTDSLLFLIRSKWNRVAEHQFWTALNANNNGNFVCRNQMKRNKKKTWLKYV